MVHRELGAINPGGAHPSPASFAPSSPLSRHAPVPPSPYLLSVMVAQSYSKNLGLYGERVGALVFVTGSKDAATR